MEALERLKSQGKIRSIGASNTTPDDVNAYMAAGQLDAVQEEYSMVKRDIETSHVPLCVENNISILSYSSLALGLLSGKIGPDRVFEGDDLRKDNPRFSTANRDKVTRLMKTVAPIAQAHGATGAQIVIAWTLQQPGITFSLCGARDENQAAENAKAGRLRLSTADVNAISKAAAQHLTDLDG
jgi:aryl-alcohol dehydrogenase-like predicted oxidoreductase